MNKHIFYSWQSNLPNKDNRNFIESCLKKAIKNDSSNSISIGYSLDKDTLNEFGSPDIPNTILKKIDSSMYFVADISVISNESPNSNVLLELGYAIAKLGWERIICVFNLKYGKIEQLPFDLKFHRVLTYNSDNPTDKSRVTEIFKKTIQSSDALVDGQTNSDVLSKQKLDKHLIYVMNSLAIIYGCKKYQFSSLFNNSLDDLTEKLTRRKILGFYAFKRFDDVIDELEKLNSSTVSFFSRRNVKSTVTNLIFSIKAFEHFCSERQTPQLFIDTKEKDDMYEVIHGSNLNLENRDSYILFKKHDIGEYEVIDFGNLNGKKHVESSIDYIVLNKRYIKTYVEKTMSIFSVIKAYLNQFDGAFNIDLTRDFDIKQKENIERLNSHKRNDYSLSADKIIDLNLLQNFPYENVISYNFFFNLLRVGTISNVHKDMEVNIKTFFQNEYNFKNKIFQPTSYDVISKNEYEKIINDNKYLVKSVILPNSLSTFFLKLQADQNIQKDKYMNDIYTKIKFNLFELLPSLIQDEISKNYKVLLENENGYHVSLLTIKENFYTNFESIERDLNLFNLHLESKPTIDKKLK
ncbi:hypothetical protein [uncultured Enterococcus sp.]|uniref:hypothetical protein n=1 Tax=uncultured Enterococcus sp. TaxID=167972 RepID=UPI00189C1DD5|nr:hypothetical protein [uncultured Enterococcus sp.]